MVSFHVAESSLNDDAVISLLLQGVKSFNKDLSKIVTLVFTVNTAQN